MELSAAVAAARGTRRRAGRAQTGRRRPGAAALLAAAGALAAALTVEPAVAQDFGGAEPAAAQEELGPLGLNEAPWNVLIVGGPAKPSTPLETLARSATASAQLSSAAASEASAVATEISANRAAEAAEEVAESAEGVSIEATRAVKHLREARTTEQGALSSALSTEQQLAAAVAQSTQYLQNLGTVGQEEVLKSGLDAELVPVYKGLQEWKMAMLHPPAKEGRMAAVKDARPYEQELAKLEYDTGRYRQKSESLSREASDMRVAAEQLAHLAVQKQAAGDLLGARDDMMRAHQMMTHSGMIDEQAATIHQAAQEANDKVPLYAVAANNAAQKAMHRFDREHVADVPLGRGRFLRPPPVGLAAR